MNKFILFILLSFVYTRDCFQEADIDAFGRSTRPDKDTFAISPSGHFYIHYDLDGINAPLPDDFNTSYYPEYILGLKALDKSKEYYEVFYQTQNLMREKYNLNNTAVIHGNGWIFYSLCNLDECLGFVAKQNHTESVFMISADGFSHSAFMSLVEGGLHVK